MKAQLLQILSDYIAERKSNNCIIDEELCLYANLHQLSPIIYFQTKDSSLLSSYSYAVSAYIHRNRMCNGLLAKLRENGVDSFQIKGDIIASYWPQPTLRTSGDCDIVVSNLETAHKIMSANGFKCISRYKGREWQYKKNGLEFEIHDRLFFKEAVNEEKITEFLNSFWSYAKDNVLDINFHFIYVIAHLRKHFMNSGVGFRQFLDIAMMEKNCTELNWTWIEQKLEEIGLLAFTQTVLAFIERWWDVVPPIKVVSVDDAFLASATDRIFENGVFGFNNPDNDNYLAANEARIGSRTAGALRVLFPNYRSLCTSDAYAFLQNKPILLPVAWIYRILRGIKRGNIKDKAKKVAGKFVSKEYIEQREKMFRQWGLAE